MPVLQPAPVVAVLCVCVQEAEAARTRQALGTIAELQRQLVSGTRRAQHGGLCALCAVMCVCTDRIQHGALGCGWCVVQAQARATPLATAVAAAAPPRPPVAGGAAVGAAAAAAGATPALVRARRAVYGAPVLGACVNPHPVPWAGVHEVNGVFSARQGGSDHVGDFAGGWHPCLVCSGCAVL